MRVCQVCNNSFQKMKRHRTQVCYSRTCRMIAAKVHYKADRGRNYAYWYELIDGRLVRRCAINARRVYSLYHHVELPPDIHIHHINNDPLDDRPDNLEAIHVFDHHAFEHSPHDAHLPGMYDVGKISSVNRPTVDGWYWVQQRSDLDFEVVRVLNQAVYLINGNVRKRAQFRPYRWGYRIEIDSCLNVC